ncbi:hypothetical protein BSL78_09802 [Apostichopus japonicus]|uniref:Uncharacterized protein n=1 Tax=Stichopus japonicus TaxID=307972 RepID=A0A2G8KZ73_STIJA|nr:hypothetical protein BSL78_09802 [Apostichopus japonicus]
MLSSHSCSHQYLQQPLDVAFMKPLSTVYTRAIEQWLENHPGRNVTIFQVACLFKQNLLEVCNSSECSERLPKNGNISFKPGHLPGARICCSPCNGSTTSSHLLSPNYSLKTRTQRWKKQMSMYPINRAISTPKQRKSPSFIMPMDISSPLKTSNTSSTKGKSTMTGARNLTSSPCKAHLIDT